MQVGSPVPVDLTDVNCFVMLSSLSSLTCKRFHFLETKNMPQCQHILCQCLGSSLKVDSAIVLH